VTKFCSLLDKLAQDITRV